MGYERKRSEMEKRIGRVRKLKMMVRKREGKRKYEKMRKYV